MDERERKIWVRWKAEPTPENASQWAVCHNRALTRGEGELLIEELDFEAKYGHGAYAAVERAAEIYLGMPFGQAMVADYHWVTESHFWLLACRPSPRTLRELSRFYEDQGMELSVGEEVQAKRDHQIGRERSKEDSRWRAEAELAKVDLKRVSTERDRLRAELSRHKDSRELKRLTAENAQLQTSYDARKEENERLARTLQKRTARREE